MKLFMPRRVSLREAFLAAEAILVLGCAQILLRVIHFQRLRRLLDRLPRLQGWIAPQFISVPTMIRVISFARRLAPVRTTCFGEALAAEALFRQCGYTPVVCLGALRDKGAFRAHAWVKVGDQVVVGGPAPVVESYRPFPEIPLRSV